MSNERGRKELDESIGVDRQDVDMTAPVGFQYSQRSQVANFLNRPIFCKKTLFSHTEERAAGKIIRHDHSVRLTEFSHIDKRSPLNIHTILSHP